jgi:hypothetical protein
MTEPEAPSDRLCEHGAAPDDGHDVFYDASAPRRGSMAETLVGALLEAGPEAGEHLLKAVHELLLAAKAVVDAGERVVEQHRHVDRGDDASLRGRRVRRIDLA